MKKRSKQTTPRARELKNRKRAAKKNAGAQPRQGNRQHAAHNGKGRPARPGSSRLPALVPAPTLLAYDAACRMLAEAKTFDQVRGIKDEWDYVKLHAQKVRDRQLLAEAIEVQTRAERRMGEIIAEAKAKGWISEGQPKKDAGAEQSRFTLDEAGIDRKLSSRTQQLAAIPRDEFESGLAAVRERVAAGAGIINGARAVMASRQQPSGDRDFAPTPPWATRALIERVLPQVGIEPGMSLQWPAALRNCLAWEPACGEGHMAEVLSEYFKEVVATDINDYGGYPDHVVDFLACEQLNRRDQDADWIITNPPFEDKAEAFALKALSIAKVGVAMFVQLRWLETIGRYERLFAKHPPTLLAFFAERVNLCMGRWDPDGTTATAYMWIVWVKDRAPQAPFWIPPGQRQALERAADRERFTAHPVIKREAFEQQSNAAAKADNPAPLDAIPRDEEMKILEAAASGQTAWSSERAEQLRTGGLIAGTVKWRITKKGRERLHVLRAERDLAAADETPTEKAAA